MDDEFYPKPQAIARSSDPVSPFAVLSLWIRNNIVFDGCKHNIGKTLKSLNLQVITKSG